MKRLCRAVRAHTGLACLALLAVLMLSVVLGISLGPVTIPFPEVWRVMLHRLLTPLGLGDWISLEGIRDSTQNIVWHLRAPRVLLGMLVGAALTLSGVGMQAFTRNPLAEPYVLGISSGASLGAVLAMLVGVWLPMGRLSVPAGAFVGALVSILLVYGLSRSGGAVTPVRLILVGVAVSAMFQAFTNYLVYTAPDDAAVREATFWMLGGLGSAKWEDLPLLALFLAAAVWCTARQFWRLGGEPDEARRRQERLLTLLYTAAQGVILLLTAEAGFGLAALVLQVGIYLLCTGVLTGGVLPRRN